ncbi:SAXO1 protein, partial [Rhinopomastus cyanomelas]|nr:SAXO1 protein [Rhinopomastus cyanomelas]
CFPCRCHRCPHLPTKIYEKSEKPCVLSEYMKQYPLHSINIPRESFKPKVSYEMVKMPMEDISTTKRDYVAHEVLPPKFNTPEKYVKSDESMDLTSTYKQDYYSCPISRVPPCLPCVTKHSHSNEMDTNTTYKEDYMMWNEPKTELIRPDNRFHPSEEKFDHKTVVQDDYICRGPVTTQSCKPLNVIQKTKSPFKSITNYKVNYVPHPLEKRYVREKEKYHVSEDPFVGLTTHKDSYKGLAGQPAKLAKPCQVKFIHDLPFSFTTEFQEKYQAWPQPPIFTKKPDVTRLPLERMDLHTTTQTDYKWPNGKPAKMSRHLTQLKKSSEPFCSSSTMKEDYKPWFCKRQSPVIHAPEMVFPAEPMDFSTTFQTHYVPHPLTVKKSYKPRCSRVKHHTLLDAKTTYNTSYTPKGTVRCLASYKVPPGYIFQGTDDDGHHFYLPVSKKDDL